MELSVNLPTLLLAVGASERVDVLRSPMVSESDSAIEPVRRYTEEHGLVLAARQEFEDDGWQMGRVEVSVYVPPSVRNGVLAGTELSLPWLPL